MKHLHEFKKIIPPVVLPPFAEKIIRGFIASKIEVYPEIQMRYFRSTRRIHFRISPANVWMPLWSKNYYSRKPQYDGPLGDIVTVHDL